jgi:hypothetical protein
MTAFGEFIAESINPLKEAVMATPNQSSPSNIPINRFETLSVSASSLLDAAGNAPDARAREALGRVVRLHAQLKEDRRALENATDALTRCKDERKAATVEFKLVVPTAINVGRLMKLDDIADFANQDGATRLTVDGLLTAFKAHPELHALAGAMETVVTRSERAQSELERVQSEYERAQVTFSTSYRSVSQELLVARAVLGALGVELPAPPRHVPAKKPDAATKPADATVTPAANTTESTVKVAA